MGSSRIPSVFLSARLRRSSGSGSWFRFRDGGHYLKEGVGMAWISRLAPTGKVLADQRSKIDRLAKRHIRIGLQRFTPIPAELINAHLSQLSIRSAIVSLARAFDGV